MKLPIIPLDKANHFIYGFVIFILANIILSGLIALIITCVFAAGKEYYDYKTYGKFDMLDMSATILPALIMYAQSLM